MINFKVNEQMRHIQIDGELDLETCKEFNDILTRLSSTPGDIMVNLGGISFVDATGLRPLLDISQTLNGRVIIINPSRFARKVLGLVENKFIVEF